MPPPSKTHLANALPFLGNQTGISRQSSKEEPISFWPNFSPPFPEESPYHQLCLKSDLLGSPPALLFVPTLSAAPAEGRREQLLFPHSQIPLSLLWFVHPCQTTAWAAFWMFLN